jgi:hypothetical protein
MLNENTTMDGFLATIDFDLLREQKNVLCDNINASNDDDAEYVEGVLSLLDSIQDMAIARGLWSYPEKKGT